VYQFNCTNDMGVKITVVGDLLLLLWSGFCMYRFCSVQYP
jgi:hypothetical protein